MGFYAIVSFLMSHVYTFSLLNSNRCFFHTLLYRASGSSVVNMLDYWSEHPLTPLLNLRHCETQKGWIAITNSFSSSSDLSNNEIRE